jgi:benzaldehyde dehydrogenase (NAD)
VTFLDKSTWQGKVFSSGWRSADGGEAPVTEPATGSELGRAGIASAADIAAAATAAAAAQPAWAALPHTERSAILRRAGDIWKANAEEIESWSIREGGKIPPATQFETHVATEEIFEAGTLPSRPYGDLLPSEQPQLSFAERIPAGVVGVIAPFNFPQIPGHPIGRSRARTRERGHPQAGPAHRRARRGGTGPRVRGAS